MEQPSQKTARRHKVIGIVTSAAGDKTIRVRTENLVKHPQYGKYYKRMTKLAAHDEKNVAKEGDTVEIVACRRISKSKSFRLLRVIRSGGIAAAGAAQG